jgi:histidyl-tRNA synthetase
MFPNTVVGSVTATGAAMNIELGFLPDKVHVINQTTGRTLTWYRSMASGGGLAAGTGTAAVLAGGSGGISPYAGSPTQGVGFTIGVDAINAVGNVLAYEAVRSGPGAK